MLALSGAPVVVFASTVTPFCRFVTIASRCVSMTDVLLFVITHVSTFPLVETLVVTFEVTARNSSP